MRHFLVAMLFAVAVSAGLLSPAEACINDRGASTEEREFKSQYEGVSPGNDVPSTDGWLTTFVRYRTPLAAVGVGVLLVGGTAVLAAVQARRS